MKFRLDHLSTLAAVIDEGSFDGAAAALHITSPAVSQRIKALEEAVGQILVRRARPVGVTEAGSVLLRLARQVGLAEEEAESVLDEGRTRPAVRIAVNADSLATWALEAFARTAAREPMSLELIRVHETESIDLLRGGAAMAAVTTFGDPVQGCRATPLGTMRYRAVASPGFAAEWFSSGITFDALDRAPMAQFDRRDNVVPRFGDEEQRERIRPPRVYVPGSREFVEAIALGMAWGYVDDIQSEALITDRRLVLLEGVDPFVVPLYWQQWRLRSRVLDALAHDVTEAARSALLA